MVFRNLAFYMFEEGDRLKDLGHDFIRELDSDKSFYTDLPMHVFFIQLILVVGSFFYNHTPHSVEEYPLPGPKRPYLINALARVMVTFTIGHLLRGTFGCTEMCMSHCQDATRP